jgi:hypothetical protein
MKQPNQRKCISCKEVFTKSHFNQKYCFKPSCVAEWTAKEKSKQWKKQKSKKKKELLTVQDHLKLTQATFNKYIRERDKGKPCISCGNKEPKKVNAGHYYSSGGHKAVTFDENNVHLQCEYCNSFLSGNLILYRENLIKRIGVKAFDKLTKEAPKTANYTRDELIEIREHYKLKIKELI